MTRSTAREIAIHLAYQLSFTELPVEEFLDQQLSDERFAELAAEDDLYADRPNTKQRRISAAWSPVWRSTPPSWTPTLKSTPGAGDLSAFHW